MFLNKIVYIKSGDGGNGLISFQKYNNKLIPNGGDGGDGGDVYFISDNNFKYFNKKIFSAKNGLIGKFNKKRGSKGKNLILKISIGSILILNNKKIFFVKNKQIIKILLGGKGGIGNFKFNYLKNNKIATNGKKGKNIFINLIFKFYIKQCIICINIDKLNINNFNYNNNFISKIYLFILNNILYFKIIKFFLYFLYIKNNKINIYWLIYDINKNFKKNKKIIINIPFFFISSIYFIGLSKIKHYLKIWKNS